jgi:DNA-binding NtrC family response regulator
MPRTLNFETVPVAELWDRNLTADRSFRPLVLIVDDESVIADTLSMILSQSGYSCIAVYDAASALEVARVTPPQLLISDVVMPGLNGIDLSVQVKALVPDCQVLLFSGQAATVDLLGDPKYAAHNFVLLNKPVHPRELLSHISDFGPELQTQMTAFQTTM